MSPLLNSRNDIDLIYVSFGTIFMNQIDVYLKILKALVSVNEERAIRVVMSAGDYYEQLLNKSVPHFIMLLKSAPQI